MKQEKLILSWDDIRATIWSLIEQLQNEPIEKIVGISRGGLIPGVMLSHRLGCDFEPLVWQTRDFKAQGWGRLHKIKQEDQSKVMFVDDICDSGLTIQQIRQLVPSSRWTVLYSKMDDNYVDFTGKRLYNDSRWVIFPWEKQ